MQGMLHWWAFPDVSGFGFRVWVLGSPRKGDVAQMGLSGCYLDELIGMSEPLVIVHLKGLECRV